MAWIEFHQQLGRHPKVLRLAGKLHIHPAQVIGHLAYLWWWSLDYVPNGDLSASSSTEIASAATWPGDADKFLAALKVTGWIDEDGMIHDWMEYAGRLVEERRKDAERKRQYRIASAGRPEDGGRTAPVPNPTVPNTTQQYRTKQGSVLKRSDRTFVAVDSGGYGGKNGTGNEVSRPQNQNHFLERVVEFSQDKSDESRAFFQKAIKKLGEGLVEEAMGEVKMRDANGSVNSIGPYLVSVLDNWMKNRS